MSEDFKMPSALREVPSITTDGTTTPPPSLAWRIVPSALNDEMRWQMSLAIPLHMGKLDEAYQAALAAAPSPEGLRDDLARAAHRAEQIGDGSDRESDEQIEEDWQVLLTSNHGFSGWYTLQRYFQIADAILATLKGDGAG